MRAASLFPQQQAGRRSDVQVARQAHYAMRLEKGQQMGAPGSLGVEVFRDWPGISLVKLAVFSHVKLVKPLLRHARRLEDKAATLAEAVSDRLAME